MSGSITVSTAASPSAAAASPSSSAAKAKYGDAPSLESLTAGVALNGKRALVTGITGQDGSYLAEVLLSRGYVVHGLLRRSSSFNTGRIEHLYEDRHDAPPGRPHLVLEYGDLADASSVHEVIARVRPHEIVRNRARRGARNRACAHRSERCAGAGPDIASSISRPPLSLSLSRRSTT